MLWQLWVPAADSGQKEGVMQYKTSISAVAQQSFPNFPTKKYVLLSYIVMVLWTIFLFSFVDTETQRL